ncbi:single-stranded-DNA-specific exonuclease RecJ [Weissella diestrammenae]|uniref:Single-stranded-DNA-specific exonuclease RecJ n=1 Tax=Weissella diestrammenae TaxID=1162633 RepID=A0A7G9T5U3_9LACO|nr:single-stranded-DNA-specific exonuclease RecJ [Weissella diestrammenae]MCM0582298.1 single-stranded-DNA-specific exonuclease RecJ [Weissella diestrammenae]QNN75468.1 single-stranded-DNA-specific exonuclease RecJ [Weissella diestrammenae]
MIASKYNWQVLASQDNQTVKDIQDAFGASQLIAQILVSRGYDTLDKVNRFLHPDLDMLYDPFLFYGMTTAVDRIMAAIDNNEKIVVYGDYDVDGMTATTIMTSALEIMGANVTYFVPSRFNDGYGPNLAAYQQLVAEGMELLITVDNGVTGYDEIAWLKTVGVDTIVTDHHELPDQLPEAVAVIHPRHPMGDYPFGALSGAGVAFKVASALLEAPADEMLDLAAIGTIADVMSLTDENRVIVALGLKSINQAPRLGIEAILSLLSGQIDQVTAETVGFQIAPRLNSLGRLKDATDGVRLLLSDDDDEAKRLATQIDSLNDERKALVDSITEQALQQAAGERQNDAVLLIVGQGWHEGVLGIVAARVLEHTGKPTIILNHAGDMMKGSARSISAFNLYQAMQPHRALYHAFGGHALAAGMTIPFENLVAVRELLNQAALTQHLAEDNQLPLSITASVSGQDFNQQNFDQLQLLAPFGQDNAEPIFLVALTNTQNVKTMSDGKHLRFTGQTSDQPLPIIGWQMGMYADALTGHYDSLEVVGTMSKNTFRGATNYQMIAKDMRAQGSGILDIRTSRLTRQTFNHTATYIFFNQKVYEQLNSVIQGNSRAIWWEDAFNLTNAGLMAFVDLPADLDQLHQVLAYVPADGWAPIFYTSHPAYLQKVPGHAEFATFYKFMMQQRQVALKQYFDQMAAHLKMSPETLRLIINVFLDAKFVTIENGFLNAVQQPVSTELEQTKSYQAYLNKREIERQLIYSSTSELEQLLNELAKAD